MKANIQFNYNLNEIIIYVKYKPYNKRNTIHLLQDCHKIRNQIYTLAMDSTHAPFWLTYPLQWLRLYNKQLLTWKYFLSCNFSCWKKVISTFLSLIQLMNFNYSIFFGWFLSFLSFIYLFSHQLYSFFFNSHLQSKLINERVL